jgi:peptide/nickel transport system ATP-binding protein
MADENKDLLIAQDVTVKFKINHEFVTAIENVSLSVGRGEVLAVVGESGSGKSTFATSVIGLHDPAYTQVTGTINFAGKDLLTNTEEEWTSVRGKDIAMIFQDPLSALNPLMKIGQQIEEALDMHDVYQPDQYHDRTIELLDQVGIVNPERVANNFPHQLSGGMRQRVVIALAIANKPKLIIADEPTTALDVTIQAQILDVLKDIQDENGAGILLITHDLGVVAEIADKVAVMYAGQIVELAPVAQLFENPKHPYTRSLLRSNPTVDSDDDELYVIQGTVPGLKDIDHKRDMFLERVPWVDEDLRLATDVQLTEINPEHWVLGDAWRTFEFEGKQD